MKKTTELTDSCVLLNLEFGMLGNSRKVNTSEIQTDADKSLLRITKHLFDAPEYKQIGSYMGELRSWIYKMTLPSYFKAGMYLVPTPLVEEIEKALEQAANSRSGINNDEEERHLPALVADFVKAYPRLVEQSISRLGGLAKVADYPNVRDIPAYFGIRWKWLDISVPTKLKQIDAKLFEIEREKARKQWEEAAEQITTLLRQTMLELTDRIVDRLTLEPDGTQKRFKESTVESLQEFMEMFDRRNVVNDTKLAALVEKGRSLLKGVDAESLRSFDGIRERVQKGFTEIKKALDSGVVNKPKRAITFED